MARKPRTGRGSGASQHGRLRIVAGKWRRRLLPVVDAKGLRPTPDRVRETLFNWLQPVIDGARCLDLCAGTGVLGFEALSRGARSATFIDNAPRVVEALREAAAILNATDAVIEQADALAWLQRPTGEMFHIVFVDPPYGADMQAELCRLLDRNGWLAPAARIYVEQDRREPDFSMPDGWQVLRHGTAGTVRYCLMSADQPRPDSRSSP